MIMGNALLSLFITQEILINNPIPCNWIIAKGTYTVRDSMDYDIIGIIDGRSLLRRAAMVGDLLYDCWFMSKPRVHILPFCYTSYTFDVLYWRSEKLCTVIHVTRQELHMRSPPSCTLTSRAIFFLIRVYNCITNIIFIFNFLY